MQRHSRKEGRSLANANGNVDAGGPITGGTELTISYDLEAASALRRGRELRDGGRALAAAPAPFFALEANLVERAINQSRCALGAPPYTVPTNLTQASIVCPVPSKPAATTLPLLISLNGQQFFATGLAFQYYEHPSLSAVAPSGGLTTVAARFEAHARRARGRSRRRAARA